MFNITGKQRESQDLQRLNGEEAQKAYAIVQTIKKLMERGITRPSAYAVA
jgi:hypothetical protein